VLATSASAGSKVPTIVNDNNIKLLFQIQKKVMNPLCNVNLGLNLLYGSHGSFY
jgi:hypothetical protein